MKQKTIERRMMNKGFPSLQGLAKLSGDALDGDAAALARLERLPWPAVGFADWGSFYMTLLDYQLQRMGSPTVAGLRELLTRAKAGDEAAERHLIGLGLTHWRKLAAYV